MSSRGPARVGVLALQGDFRAHVDAFTALGAHALEVRSAEALDGLDAVVLPGGESSAIGLELVESGLDRALRRRAADGLAVLGTCAGAILMAGPLGLLDAELERNAYGRQLESFVAEVESELGALEGVFIRAPRVSALGPGVRVVGRLGDGPLRGEPVWLACGRHMAVTFHPEWGPDRRVQAAFVEGLRRGSRARETAA